VRAHDAHQPASAHQSQQACTQCGAEPHTDEADAGIAMFQPLTCEADVLAAIHESNYVPVFILMYRDDCTYCNKFKRAAYHMLKDLPSEVLDPDRGCLFCINDAVLAFPGDVDDQGALAAGMTAHWVFEHLQVPPENARPAALIRIPRGNTVSTPKPVVGLPDVLSLLKMFVKELRARTPAAGDDATYM